MIRDPFQVVRDEQQVRGLHNERWMTTHGLMKFIAQMMIEQIHVVICCHNMGYQGEVMRYKRNHNVLEHLADRIGEARHIYKRPLYWFVGQFASHFGDVYSVIPDT